MPVIKVKNKSKYAIARANKTFPPKKAINVNIRENQMYEVVACTKLEIIKEVFTEKFKDVDFDNLDDYKAEELKEICKRAKVKYWGLTKDELVKALLEKYEEEKALEEKE